uniref:Eukaryotic translation initiation factor 3 subunit B n=1 Tax=Steinernema glaseri TaxID=37863 RepID=A0A1I7ZVC5_9BILA
MAVVDNHLTEKNEEPPSFSDPEDFVDTFDEEEHLGEELAKKPDINEYERCCIIIHGIPVVGEDRFQKLKNVLNKLFTATCGPNYVDEYAYDEEGKTKSFCFLYVPTRDAAESVQAILDNHVLDKKHVFKTSMLSDILHMEKPDEKFETPAPKSVVDVGDLWSWLQNEKCQDQFALQYLNGAFPHVSINWYMHGQEPQEAVGRSQWTESVFKWSPHGSYLSTIHFQGVAIWGGEKFDRVMRFLHEGVAFLDFSPNEKYLVTHAPSNQRGAMHDPNSLRIFDVNTGEMLKGFSLHTVVGSNRLNAWPFFKWSHDEKYFACLKPGGNGILVYDADTFTLNNKRSIVLEGITEFQWSPTRNQIGYYCAERPEQNTPSEIGVMEFPSREKLRSHRLFSVQCAELYWQKCGDHLAAHTERYTKRTVQKDNSVKFSGISSHLEVFECKTKEISVQSMPLTEPFAGFAWDPNSDKFCVLVGNDSKVTPQVYRLDSSKHIPQLVSKLDAGVKLNHISFAPAGGWLVVASMDSSSGNVFFIDTNKAEPTRTNCVEHAGFNRGYWDPTGRYYVTCTVATGRSSVDCGYRLYTFQGRELLRKNAERLSQFHWRPRPPVKLSDAKIKEIRKNMKTTAQKFEEEDKRERGKASKEVVEKRRKVMEEFNEVREANRSVYDSEKDERIKLRGGFDCDAPILEEELVNETITVPLSTEQIKVEEDGENQE